MTTMAVLARYGHVQPDVYAEMEFLEAQELARRVMDLHHREQEAYSSLHLELTKALIRASGARIL